jgi:two-component system, cell cycle sensor histidine kinase and response regulator CckA
VLFLEKQEYQSMAQQKEVSVKPKDSSPEKSHSLYILLVEDEPTHTVVLRHTIRTAFPDVILKIAGSLKEYRKSIENSTPDLVLMDLHLPDGKAIDLLTATSETKLFPIVVMTSLGDERTAVKAMKAGALDYIVKSNEAFKTMPRIIERALHEWKLIQDRKQAEDELRESELRYRSLYDNVTVGLYRTTPAGKILLANQSLVKMLGYSSFEELAVRNLAKTGFARTYQRKEFLRKIEAEGEIDNFESTWIRQDGSLIIVLESARAVRNSHGKTIYYDGTVEDITERRLAETAGKYAEDALSESERKYHNLFDNAVEGIFSTTPEGRLTNVNYAFARILGYESPEEIISTVTNIGQQLYVNPNDRKKVISLLKERGFLKDYEIQMRKKDGSSIWTSTNVRVIKTPEGRVNFEGSITDITERKETEEALRNSEEIFRKAFMTSPDSININRLEDGLFVSINPGYTRITGYTETDIVGKTSAEINIWDDLSDRAKLVEGLKKNGLVENLVARFRLKNGEKKYGMMSATIIVLSGVKHILSITRDITERKQVETVLQERDIRFKKFASQVPGMLYQFLQKPDGTFCVPFTSEGIRDIFGCSPQDVQDDFSPIAKVVLPEDLPILTDSIKNSARHLIPWQCEYRVQIPGHPIRWLYGQSMPEKLSDGSVIWYGFNTDITERKQAEEAIQHNERQFKTLFMSLNDGFYISEVIYDDNGNPCDYRYIEVNPKFEQILGLNRDQIIGKRYKEIVPVDTSNWLDNYFSVARTGLPNTYEFTSNEYNKCFETYSYQSTEGRISVFVRDITERKKTEETVRQMQRLEGLGTLAGGIAHDFNNILGIILAYNTGIKRFKDDTKKLELATETITKAVNRGKTLVQQILTFARKTETAFGAVNVNEVVMEIMTMILETFPKTLTYTQNFEKGLPYINADRTQLYQAILNLCVNARDAMPNGGMLTINTRIAAGTDLIAKHPDVADNDYICIEVNDTGEGMTEEVKKRIFEPFFTTKGIGKGTGLGLAVVFGVIQTHKGFVDVESEIGKGTTFKLYMPALKAEESISEKEEETLEEIPGGTETLLLVEDEEMLIMSLQMVLVEKGYNVLPARDGLEALKIYQENKNDIALVLTDLGLPTISGLEVCQRIKKIKSNERVILATGYLDPEMKSEFLKAGIQHFLYKPYDLKIVLREVRNVLDEKLVS